MNGGGGQEGIKRRVQKCVNWRHYDSLPSYPHTETFTINNISSVFKNIAYHPPLNNQSSSIEITRIPNRRTPFSHHPQTLHNQFQ